MKEWITFCDVAKFITSSSPITLTRFPSSSLPGRVSELNEETWRCGPTWSSCRAPVDAGDPVAERCVLVAGRPSSCLGTNDTACRSSFHRPHRHAHTHTHTTNVIRHELYHVTCIQIADTALYARNTDEKQRPRVHKSYALRLNVPS